MKRKTRGEVKVSDEGIRWTDKKAVTSSKEKTRQEQRR